MIIYHIYILIFIGCACRWLNDYGPKGENWQILCSDNNDYILCDGRSKQFCWAQQIWIIIVFHRFLNIYCFLLGKNLFSGWNSSILVLNFWFEINSMSHIIVLFWLVEYAFVHLDRFLALDWNKQNSYPMWNNRPPL